MPRAGPAAAAAGRRPAGRRRSAVPSRPCSGRTWKSPRMSSCLPVLGQSAPVVREEEGVRGRRDGRLNLDPTGGLLTLVDESVGAVRAYPDEVAGLGDLLVAVDPATHAAADEVVDLFERVVVHLRGLA